MAAFEYDHCSHDAEYYELLDRLIERWEYEIVEFKEAKGQYSENKIGQYFSAISNEANLKQQQYGWFIMGVSEGKEKYPVGTAFKEGKPSLLERFKYNIAKNVTDGLTFLDIIELYPVVSGTMKRVLMFKVPAAATGMPTAWNTRYYGRSGESLVALSQAEIDTIRSQERRDWSKQILNGAEIGHLDKQAIQFARIQYKEKMKRPHISEEVDVMSDEEFLTKIKLMRNHKVTNAAMILLGNPDFDSLFENPPVMMWRLYGTDDAMKDYAIFSIPFILVADQIFGKIRNLSYRYMPNQLSLFPKETQQYDTWLLRELLNNCIAHSNYQLGGRIYLNECEDSINIVNPGDFLPQTIETVLQTTYNPPFYRNQLLSDAMVKFHMIDTATSGIKKVFRIQKDKYFPMPDYDFSVGNQVSVTVYGKTLDEKYTHILFNHPELDLEDVYLLDRIQKGKPISKKDTQRLRKYNLVEGRANNLFLSAEVAQSIDQEAEYIRNKGFKDQYYRDMIVNYIRQYGKAQKKDIKKLLWEMLPDVLDDGQKEGKVRTLLTSLRKQGRIQQDSSNHQKANWVLTEKEQNDVI